MPTPAAEPNQFSSPYTSFARSGSFTGRIKFSTASGSMSGYLSQYLDRSTGLLVVTQNPSQALQVQWKPSDLMTTFEVLVCIACLSVLPEIDAGLERTVTVRINSLGVLPEIQGRNSGMALQRNFSAMCRVLKTL